MPGDLQEALLFLSTAVCLAEEVLAIREDTLNVTEIPEFVNLINGFTSRQLASFCRVLAMVVFEPEVPHGSLYSWNALDAACFRSCYCPVVMQCRFWGCRTECQVVASSSKSVHLLLYPL